MPSPVTLRCSPAKNPWNLTPFQPCRELGTAAASRASPAPAHTMGKQQQGAGKQRNPFQGFVRCLRSSRLVMCRSGSSQATQDSSTRDHSTTLCWLVWSCLFGNQCLPPVKLLVQVQCLSTQILPTRAPAVPQACASAAGTQLYNQAAAGPGFSMTRTPCGADLCTRLLVALLFNEVCTWQAIVCSMACLWERPETAWHRGREHRAQPVGQQVDGYVLLSFPQFRAPPGGNSWSQTESLRSPCSALGARAGHRGKGAAHTSLSALAWSWGGTRGLAPLFRTQGP